MPGGPICDLRTAPRPACGRSSASTSTTAHRRISPCSLTSHATLAPRASNHWLPSGAATVKLGFYSPSLPVAGGGEKYFLTIVEEAAACRRPQDEVIIMSPSPPQPQVWRRLGVSVGPESFTWR